VEVEVEDRHIRPQAIHQVVREVEYMDKEDGQQTISSQAAVADGKEEVELRELEQLPEQLRVHNMSVDTQRQDHMVVVEVVDGMVVEVELMTM